MAKLSARNRHELARLEKVVEPAVVGASGICRERTTITIMSDGALLKKRDAWFAPELNLRPICTGWKLCRSRLSPSLSVDEACAILEGKGYARVGVRPFLQPQGPVMALLLAALLAATACAHAPSRAWVACRDFQGDRGDCVDQSSEAR